MAVDPPTGGLPGKLLPIIVLVASASIACTGKTAPQDCADAPSCLARCGDGEGRSCRLLGLMLENGFPGVVADPVKAVNYYKMGCEAGDPKSCERSRAADKTATSPSSKPEAPPPAPLVTPPAAPDCHEPGVCLARCEGGETSVCVVLGSMYENGIGVPADRAKASAAYKRACEQGDPRGCERGKPIDAELAFARLKDTCHKCRVRQADCLASIREDLRAAEAPGCAGILERCWEANHCDSAGFKEPP